MHKDYDFYTATKIEDEWKALRKTIDEVSHYVFYKVLGMMAGHVCHQFRFELRAVEPLKHEESNTITYQLPKQVVVQEYQNGSHIEPYANAAFSYPIDWLNYTTKELAEMLGKNPELAKLAVVDHDGKDSDVHIC